MLPLQGSATREAMPRIWCAVCRLRQLASVISTVFRPIVSQQSSINHVENLGQFHGQTGAHLQQFGSKSAPLVESAQDVVADPRLDPRAVERGFLLKCIDRRRFLHRLANIIQPIQQTVFLKRVHFEGKRGAVRGRDRLRFEVDLDPCV